MKLSTTRDRAGAKATLATVGIVLAPLLVVAGWIYLGEMARMRETRGLRWVICDQLWSDGLSLLRRKRRPYASPRPAVEAHVGATLASPSRVSGVATPPRRLPGRW